MIKRLDLKNKIQAALGWSRAVALLGPRQCGKTTLAREFVPADSPNYFDLESAESLVRLENAQFELGRLRGLVVIDEVQRRPELFPVLRVLLDRKPLPAKFLILGSASPELLRQSSESLAGRLATITMGGLELKEVGMKRAPRHWLRGGFPLSFLAKNDLESFLWRRDFIQAFLDKDLREQGITIPTIALHRFWKMLAHMHGQLWRGVDPASSLGVSEPTVRRYLDILTGVFMVRQLQPWYANIQKRQVKSPKIYLRDTGLLHQLLGIKTHEDLLSHPRCGASWEGYVIQEILSRMDPDEAYFWATHHGAEIDLIFTEAGRWYGIECKRSDVPKLTPSLKIALETLKLEKIAVIHPGTHRYALADRIEAVPFSSIIKGFKWIFS